MLTYVFYVYWQHKKTGRAWNIFLVHVVRYSEPDWITNRRCVVLTSFNVQLVQNSL